jgi:hypothetical protein
VLALVKLQMLPRNPGGQALRGTSIPSALEFALAERDRANRIERRAGAVKVRGMPVAARAAAEE